LRQAVENESSSIKLPRAEIDAKEYMECYRSRGGGQVAFLYGRYFSIRSVAQGFCSRSYSIQLMLYLAILPNCFSSFLSSRLIASRMSMRILRMKI
jgi:hypothetical protein